jgi:hypothetical protein
MQVETKFLRLCQPAALGEQIDGWRVCWLGGWGKKRLFYYVMVARVKRLNPNLFLRGGDRSHAPAHFRRRSSDHCI